MSKKINYAAINNGTIDTINSFLYATSGVMKDAIDLAKATLLTADSAREALLAERDTRKQSLILEGMLTADAITQSVNEFADRLNQANSALTEAENALATLQEKKRNAYNKGLTVIPDSVYDAYKSSARKVDVTAYINATTEMLAGFGLSATEVQTAKLADLLSRWAGGLKKATGKKAEEGHRKAEQVKRTLKASMLDALVEYLVWEAKSFRYNADKTGIVLYTGEDKQEQA